MPSRAGKHWVDSWTLVWFYLVIFIIFHLLPFNVSVFFQVNPSHSFFSRVIGVAVLFGLASSRSPLTFYLPMVYLHVQSTKNFKIYFQQLVFHEFFWIHVTVTMWRSITITWSLDFLDYFLLLSLSTELVSLSSTMDFSVSIMGVDNFDLSLDVRFRDVPSSSRRDSDTSW